MSINKLVASILISFVVLTLVAQVVLVIVIVNSPDECRSLGGEPVRGESKRCKLSDN
jgi:hypothetical protein